MPDSWDDEELLAALGEAMRARQAVPEWFVETGKNAYAWHDIDAEMAQLTYDSLVDRERLAVVRSEAASIRALAFTSSSRWPRTHCSDRSSRRGPARSRSIPRRA